MSKKNDTLKVLPGQLSLFDYQQSIPSKNAEYEFSEHIRRIEFEGTDYIVLTDIMAEFSDLDSNPSVLWTRTKKALKEQGFQSFHGVKRLPVMRKNGKPYPSDCATIETCLRIIQSIPSKNAEKVREWLASLGTREIDESIDPESAIHRTLDNAIDRYAKQGKDNEWISERLKGVDARRTLTNAIAGAINSDDMPVNMYSVTTETLYKGLWERVTAILRQDLNMPPKGGNVRDHFGTYALIYTGLAERVAGELINQAGELTPGIVMEIVWKVAVMIKKQANQTAEFLGRDLVTDKPLLRSGE